MFNKKEIKTQYWTFYLENHYGNSLCTLLSRKILYEAFESREKDCFDAQTLAKMVSKQVLADGCVQREIIIVSSGRFHIDLLANFLAEMAIVPSANAGDCNVARIGVCHKCQKSTFKDEDSLLQHFIECTEIKSKASFFLGMCSNFIVQPTEAS